MRPFIILALFVAGACANYGMPAVRVESSGYAAPAMSSSYGSAVRQVVPITRFNHEITGSDHSALSYETGNGIRVADNTQVVHGRGGSYTDEYGKLVQSSSTVTKQGSYSFTSPEGQNFNVNWHADENGFRAQGDHLPTPPPIPAEIAASLRSSGSSYSSYAAPAPVRAAGGY